MNTRPTPCEGCPWRRSNRGKRHALGWYTLRNLRRLWRGLRTGEAPGMSCHETDPDVLRPEGAAAPPEGSAKLACAGAWLLVQRELTLFQDECNRADDNGGFARYRERTPNGLTKDGVAYWVCRVLFGGTPFGDGPKPPRLDECADIARPGVEGGVAHHGAEARR